jgi:hypothetical protein
LTPASLPGDNLHSKKWPSNGGVAICREWGDAERLTDEVAE